MTSRGPHITPRQAIDRLARGERLAFIDARPEEQVERTGCRIPGAVRLGPGAIQRSPTAPALPPGEVLVVYGQHAGSYEPAAVAEQLDAHGFRHVHVLAGGVAGWSELRCPTELARTRSRARPERPRHPRPALRLVAATPRP